MLIKSGYVNTVYLTYLHDPESTNITDACIEAYVSSISDLIKPDMTSREVILLIHDFIIRNTQYVTDIPDADNIYGVFVNSKATCSGYAKAFKYICDMNGIPCICVTGSAKGSHMWNMVYLDSKWYCVDCTWDDPDFRDKTIIYRDYCLVEPEELMETHTFDSFYYNLLSRLSILDNNDCILDNGLSEEMNLAVESEVVIDNVE